MYNCYICENQLDSVPTFRSHLQTHLIVGDLTLPIKCRQGQCKSTFNKLFNFVRHLQHFHVDCQNVVDNCPSSSTVSVCEITADDMSSECDTDLPVIHRKRDRDCVQSLQQDAAAMVAALRANSSIPYAVITDIVQSVDNMIGTTVDFCHTEAITLLRDAGSDDSVLTTVHCALKQQRDTLNRPLSFLSTRYKQDQFFDTHPLAVKPETVVLGQRYETRGGATHLVYDTYQYVSVEATLQSLLSDPQYVNMLISDTCTPGLISDCWDGLLYKHHPLLSNKSQFCIALQLFYDGMGTTNPLRGQSSLCNVGVFYFIIKNLPNVVNSCFSNVHLLSLCYAQDLKTYGFRAVLSKLVREIKHLSETGFAGSFPVLGTRTVYVSLVQVAGDNLALNSLLGFVESFRVDYFCTMCTATQADIQFKFYETEFELRSVATYTKDVANVACSDRPLLHSHGVKAECVLNEIPGFHAVHNFSLDIMHTVLEGIVLTELSCVLFHLCNEYHELSLSVLNSRMHSFWSVINVDKGNKPPELNHIDKPGRLYPSMKAIQSWALLKYLPLLLGDVVPADDKHWLFLLHLSELVDILFAPVFTVGMVTYLRHLIADHLVTFSELYSVGDSGIRLKPKHHLLVHLPTIILRSGPLVGMNCMRYELKNSFFKRCSHIMCNFSNVCKTLAYRHQQYSLFSKLSSSHVRNAIVVGHNSSKPVCTLDCADVLCSHFGIEQTDDVFIATRIERASIVYKAGHHVVVGVDEEPEFGEIIMFVCVQSTDDWFIVVSCLRTTDFVAHYHSYSVEDVTPKSYKVLAFADLTDFHPVCRYKKRTEKRTVDFVRLPYHVM